MPRSRRPAAHGVIQLDDSDIDLQPQTDKAGWLFSDFDRIFRHIAAITGSREDHYDIYGHSAGGQILHRMAIFYPRSRADRIIAANAGFYTLPEADRALPFGIADMDLSESDLEAAFSSRLTLLLGARDNHETAGGTFLRTPATDRQGAGRLQRGRTFLETAERRAAELETPLNWTLRTVPDVGHDHVAMSAAAARILYE